MIGSIHGASTGARSVALAGGVLAAHALPAITCARPLTRRLVPTLAGVGDAGRVALTIDDGPHAVATPRFLRLLDSRRVRATFFLLGEQLARAPELGRELVDAGHEIAVHGWTHRCLLLRGPRSTRDDITRAREYIAEVTGVSPHWYRPPYGVLSGPALLTARQLGLKPILWTAWGRDWELRATPSSVFDTVTRDLAGGGTILLHDSDCTSAPGSWAATLGALPRILDECARRGLVVGPLRSHRSPT
ncbi:MAG: polysaccharide deacetylase family protein [Kutzneria sp.]|nr:polysaccharide deacetylase family protein [Kutzneria sp.]